MESHNRNTILMFVLTHCATPEITNCLVQEVNHNKYPEDYNVEINKILPFKLSYLIIKIIPVDMI